MERLIRSFILNYFKNQWTCWWDIIVISVDPMATPKLGHINLLLICFFAQ
jgi:hypothetical protein